MSVSTVLKCCQRMAQEGKTVSVALVRAKCGATVSLQDVIAGVKQWRNTPQQQRDKMASDAAPAHPKTPSVLSLEQRVVSLEAEVAQLRAEMRQLKMAGLDAVTPKNQQD